MRLRYECSCAGCGCGCLVRNKRYRRSTVSLSSVEPCFGATEEEMPELRKLAALILVRMAYVGNESDFAAMVQASVKEVERELKRQKRAAKRNAEESLLWKFDKELSPEPIREALSAMGF